MSKLWKCCLCKTGCLQACVCLGHVSAVTAQNPSGGQRSFRSLGKHEIHFPWLFPLAKNLAVIPAYWTGEGASLLDVMLLVAINSFGFVRTCGGVALESVFMEIIHLSGQEHILSPLDNKLLLSLTRQIKRDILTQRNRGGHGTKLTRSGRKVEAGD